MSLKHSHAEKRTDSTELPPRLRQSDRGRIRDKHIPLGVDGRGRHQVYHTQTETIHIISEDGSRGRKILPADKDIEDYVTAVENAHGWQTLHYGQSCVDILVESVDR